MHEEWANLIWYSREDEWLILVCNVNARRTFEYSEKLRGKNEKNIFRTFHWKLRINLFFWRVPNDVENRRIKLCNIIICVKDIAHRQNIYLKSLIHSVGRIVNTQIQANKHCANITQLQLTISTLKTYLKFHRFEWSGWTKNIWSSKI